jgi:hypothetical protein
MQRRPRQWLGTAALMLVGCASTCDESSRPGTIGELGNGRFLYECEGMSDPACESGSDADHYFPECIALGGVFDLEYMLLDNSALESNELSPVIYVESIHQGFFRGTDQFEALRAGKAAFVVRESERVLDILHLEIVEPDSMDVFGRDPATPTTTITVAVGATEILRVFPRSFACPELGGSVPIQAESSDPAIASLSTDEVLRIQGQAPGTAVVRVQLGALEQAITVEVTDGPIEPGTDSGTGDTSDSSGSDAQGTGSSADTAGVSSTDASTGETGAATGTTTGGT